MKTIFSDDIINSCLQQISQHKIKKFTKQS